MVLWYFVLLLPTHLPGELTICKMHWHEELPQKQLSYSRSVYVSSASRYLEELLYAAKCDRGKRHLLTREDLCNIIGCSVETQSSWWESDVIGHLIGQPQSVWVCHRILLVRGISASLISLWLKHLSEWQKMWPLNFVLYNLANTPLQEMDQSTEVVSSLWWSGFGDVTTGLKGTMYNLTVYTSWCKLYQCVHG